MVVPFLGYLFRDKFQIYGHGFQQSLELSGFMGMVFCKIHLLVNCFGIFRFMGMIFRKFSRFIGIFSRNFSGFMGGTFTI